MNNDFDIIIVGGGMVGLTMAASLAQSQLKIALIEKHALASLDDSHWLSPQAIKPDAFDTRVSAISPGNQQYLQKLGCWQNIPHCRVADYESMQVWDANGSGHIRFDAAEIARDKLGSIVENQVLRAAIYQTLKHNTRITLIERKQVTSINEQIDFIQLQLGDAVKSENAAAIVDSVDADIPEQIKTKLLIAADGAFSDVRKQLGIFSEQMSYQQSAFVANVRTERSHQNTAWQRFTEYGPVAFLPLAAENLCSIVWSVDSAQAQKINLLESKAFENQLASAFEHRLGNIELVSNIQSFPLAKRHAQHYIKPRCVLIGDAAHTIHPLAGQGVNLGFHDVSCLAGLIEKCVAQSRDFGLCQHLNRYARERRSENLLVQEAMSGFKWLFGEQNMANNLIRNFALSQLNQSAMGKQLIMKRAMA